MIAAYAPEGTNALKAAHADKSAERESLKKALDLFPTEAVADPEAETLALAAARGMEDVAMPALEKGREEYRTHVTQIAIAKQMLAAFNETLLAEKKNPGGVRGEISDAELAALLENARDFRRFPQRSPHFLMLRKLDLGTR